MFGCCRTLIFTPTMHANMKKGYFVFVLFFLFFSSPWIHHADLFLIANAPRVRRQVTELGRATAEQCMLTSSASRMTKENRKLGIKMKRKDNAVGASLGRNINCDNPEKSIKDK